MESSLADNYYCFLHDRILQSAHQLNTLDEIKESNFQFGNYYKVNFPDTKVFDICNFYNKSFDLFTKEEDILDLVHFHYKAILLSKANIAYDNGLNFAKLADRKSVV